MNARHMDIKILEHIGASQAFDGHEWLTSPRLLAHGIKVCSHCGKLNALESLRCVECGVEIFTVTNNDERYV